MTVNLPYFVHVAEYFLFLFLLVDTEGNFEDLLVPFFTSYFLDARWGDWERFRSERHKGDGS